MGFSNCSTVSDFEIEISKTGEVNWRQQVWTTLSRTFAIKGSAGATHGLSCS